MRLVHITNDYETRAGNERMLTHVMLRLPQHEHHLFSLHRLNPALYQDLRALPHIAIGDHYDMRWRKQRMVTKIPEFRAALRRIQPDCVLSWLYHSNAFAAATLATMRRRPRLVWNVRHSLDDLDAESRSTHIAISLCRALSGRADAIVFNSARARAQHAALGFPDARAHHLPNGVDAGVFTPAAPARSIAPGEELRIGTLARDHPVKNLDGLLDALAQVQDLPWRLFLRGQGVSGGRLAARATALGIASRCSFDEEVDSADFLRTLDVFVLPSHSEGFPNALCEAMSSGLACLATDVGDAGAIVGDAGVVVPRGDVAALTTGLRDIIRRRTTEPALGERARAHVVAHFSLARTIARFEAIAAGRQDEGVVAASRAGAPISER